MLSEILMLIPLAVLGYVMFLLLHSGFKSIINMFKDLGFTKENWIKRTLIILFLLYIEHTAGPAWSLGLLFGGYVVHMLDKIYILLTTIYLQTLVDN